MRNEKLSNQVPSSKFQVVLMLLLFFSPLLGVDKQKLLDCYEIFDQKKAELEAEAEKILEQKEALEALKNTYMALIKKKEQKLKLKEQEINASLKKIENEKKRIEELLKENKKILEDIKNAKLDKITQSYAKMRAKNAAEILSKMPEKKALLILQKLQPKVLAKIFSKMDPTIAAKLSDSLLKIKENNESTTNP
ncbi:MotE family protein [Caminibacter profundus]